MSNMQAAVHYLEAPIERGEDLSRLRKMLGMNQSTFALTIGRSVGAISKAEKSSSLPKDIKMLAQTVLDEHKKKVAVRVSLVKPQKGSTSGMSAVAQQRLIKEIEGLGARQELMERLALVMGAQSNETEIVPEDELGVAGKA